MKNIIIFSILASGVTLFNIASAACTSPLVTNPASVLEGNTMCSNNSQEEHHASRDLWDYKLGDNHPGDHRKKIGTWNVVNVNGITSIKYTYDNAGGEFTFTLHSNGGNSYTYCGPEIVDATLKIGINVGCSTLPAP